MKRAVIQRLLLLYPAKWRNEYGAELEDLLLAERLRFTVILNVVRSALGQQVRVSNHPAGLIRPLALMTGGVGAVFVLGLILSVPLWTLMLSPMADALAQSGRPARLIQNKPLESFAIIWLGLPLLITAFVAYPFLLWLVRANLASNWTPQNRRRATAFGIWSGGLFFLSGVSVLVAWEHGVVLTLRGFEPLVRHTSIMSVSDCFSRFARSMLEFGILVQIPVLAFFMPGIKKSSWTQTLKWAVAKAGPPEGPPVHRDVQRPKKEIEMTVLNVAFAVGAFLCGVRAMGYWVILQVGGVRPADRRGIALAGFGSALLFVILSSASAYLLKRRRCAGYRRQNPVSHGRSWPSFDRYFRDSVERRRPANAGSGGSTGSVRRLCRRIPGACSEAQPLTVVEVDPRRSAGVHLRVWPLDGVDMCYKARARRAGVLDSGDGKGSGRWRTCTGIRTARLGTSATAAIGVDLAQSPGATLLSR